MILVTGATGHLGANLVRALLTEGQDVRVLLKGAAGPALDGLAVHRVPGDVRDGEAVGRAVSGCEEVYHCAARVSTGNGARRQTYDVNVLGTHHVLAAARRAGVRRVVVTGSLSATGWRRGVPCTEEDLFYPFGAHTPYTISKVLAEHECAKAATQGLDVVVATSTAIIGPHDYRPSRMGRLLLDFANGRLLAYVPGGFEFVSVGDLVAGHMLAMRRGVAGRKYLFSTQYHTVEELLGHYGEVCGRRRRPLRVPSPVMAGIARAAAPVVTLLAPRHEMRLTPAAVDFLRSRRRADCSRAVTELGYRPTSVAHAVREAFACFARRGLVEARRAPSVPGSRPGRSARRAAGPS
ncbi:NAD-dependent epimerase/dehydratase family protein [Streptomyces sp. UNOC14_S4]|uniref:NAD-dependent epimerase/dehydratase family protein n=1 Tax=Streptomyces sp. UNOC14_S4 TaxID=2872340 RepID=UPI001E2F10FA|nr:NAD-dependent epimerase/dehydratase family protein [Streptomyces sp. UNOC14_S4]MCC3766906.1 NAD-dependent epimerase/dehydratase family protein [Streptomyces sp. UNOC14_S4]